MPRVPAGSSDDQEIGGKLKAARQAAGLTQGQLGEALDVSFQQVQKYERGTNGLRAAALRRIYDVLDVAPTYFVPSGPDDALASVMPEGFDGDLLREASDLLRAYCRIKDPKVRRSVLALAVAVGREGTGDDVGDPP